MRVTDLSKIQLGQRSRVSALVSWEEAQRPQQRIHFDVPLAFAEAIRPNPNAFLAATAMFALRHGEERLQVEGELCPFLRDGVVSAMQQVGNWNGPPFDSPPTIEASRGFSPPVPAPGRRTASMMSGGIDALTRFRRNRLDFPLDHPGSIRDCLFLYGFDLGCHEDLDGNEDAFEAAVISLGAMASASDAELIPVYTNIYTLDDDDDLAFRAVFGSTLASVGHLFQRRIGEIHIGSSDVISSGLKPMGSHPMIDPWYGSADLRVVHGDAWMTRMDKVRLIAEWPEGLSRIRACFDFFRPAGQLNCGACEKCLRTMTALVVCEKLSECSAFAPDDVTRAMLQVLRTAPVRVNPNDRRATLHVAMRTLSPANITAWRELSPLLAAAGRSDLTDVLETKFEEYRSHAARREGRDLIGRLSELDRRHLGGRIERATRGLRRS